MPAKDDLTSSNPMQTSALPSALRIRKGLTLPQCAIDGCEEPPTERLAEHLRAHDEIWCKPHCDMVAGEIARRNYQDFIQQLQKMGVAETPILTDQRLERVENRRCCVPKCTGAIVTGTEIASPFKQPGFVWVCQSHYPALDYVLKQFNGLRVIHELWNARKQKPDPEKRTRKMAILSAYAKCQDKTRYIECVCRCLQKDHINIPPKWRERWGNELNLRFEPYGWLNAYQDKRIRGTIQRHISRECKAKLRTPPK